MSGRSLRGRILSGAILWTLGLFVLADICYETVRGIVADLDERVRALLVELVPGIELPASVLER